MVSVPPNDTLSGVSRAFLFLRPSRGEESGETLAVAGRSHRPRTLVAGTLEMALRSRHQESSCHFALALPLYLGEADRFLPLPLDFPLLLGLLDFL